MASCLTKISLGSALTSASLLHKTELAPRAVRDKVRTPQPACIETLGLLRKPHGNSSFGKV